MGWPHRLATRAASPPAEKKSAKFVFRPQATVFFLHLVDGESGGGVGELPHERGGEPVVERQDALVADNPCGLLDDADVLRLSCRLQVHLEQVQRVGAAGGARARQAAEVPPAHLLGGVLARHDFQGASIYRVTGLQQPPVEEKKSMTFLSQL